MAKKKSGKKSHPLYRFIRFMVWVFFPKYTLEGTENLPEEPAVLIGNHSKANGPVALQLLSLIHI